MWMRISGEVVEAAVCIAVGLVLFAGVRLAGSLLAGVVILIAVAAIFAWSRFASRGTSPDDIFVNIVVAVFLFLCALGVFGFIFDRMEVVRYVLIIFATTITTIIFAVVIAKSRQSNRSKGG